MPRTLALDVTSAEDAAKAIRFAASQAGYQGLMALPWNRFGADSPTWWLSPSTEVPAYKCGKIVFTRRDSESGSLFIGLYLEKGVGAAATPAFSDTKRGRSYIMTPDWTWHFVTRALRDGAFDRVVAEAEERAGRPILIGVDASNVEVPTGRGDARSAVRELAEGRRDLLRFEWSQGRLRCVRSDAPMGILRGREGVKSLPELAEVFELTENRDWVWIDFQAGRPFLLGVGGPDADVWSEEQVWIRACAPWRSWLR